MKKQDKSDTYKREIITGKNFDYWFDWMVNNVEIAEKEYPEMMELVREMVKEAPPYFIAAIIEKIPEQFVKWKNDIENCLTSTREKKINTYIELIELLLYQLEFGTNIENNAVKKIKPELIEMEQYFKNLLHPSQKKKGFQSKLTDNQIKSLYEQMQGNYFDTSPENFEAMLTDKKCYPIDWLHKNNHGEINKTSLVAFIETILKQTKKVSKTHFKTEITSGIKKDMYYKRYELTFSDMIK